MEDRMIQKLLDSIQAVQGSIDGRLAAVEKKVDGADHAAASVQNMRTSLDELKAVIRNVPLDVNAVAQYGGFKSQGQCEEFGLWALGVLAGRAKALNLLGDRNKALAEGVNATGGALVPEEFIGVLVNLLKKYGVFRRFARQIPMGSDRTVLPKIDSDVTIYVPGEGGTITPSQPSFANVALQAFKPCALTAFSSELEEDSAVALGMILMDSMARATAKVEDEIGFLGNGSSTYYGQVGIAGSLLGVDSTIGNIKSLVVGSGNSYGELILGDFDEVVAVFPDDFDTPGETRWYMSRFFYWTVVRPLIQAYSGNLPTVGAAAETEEGAPLTLRGYPVTLTSVMPKVEANSQICAVLANLNMGAYQGERRRFEVQRSRDAYFTSDQIGVRATERIAINVFGVGDTTDAGPIVGLITAAS